MRFFCSFRIQLRYEKILLRGIGDCIMSEQKKNRRNSSFLYKVILVIGSICAVIIFIRFYQISKDNLVNMELVSIQNSEKELDNLFQIQINRVNESAAMIESIKSSGKTNEDIKEYLETENKILSSVAEEEFMDIYGSFDGEYIDGAGWTPDSDYSPVQRSWYKKAKKMDGEVGIVSPYKDMRTGKIIISYSKLLKDKKSVISYDVTLDETQKLVEKMVGDECIKTIIIDDNERIVASSNSSEIGHRFGTLLDKESKALYKKYLTSKNENFEYTYSGNNYYVYNKPLICNLKYLILIDADEMFLTLNRAVYCGWVIIAILVLVEILVIYDINKRRRIAEENLEQIKQLFQAANTDKLTGISNRRAYEEMLEQITNLGIPKDFVYISLDLNGLKTVNDNMGHAKGDELISGAAECISDIFGQQGSVYRIGGDEFAALLGISSKELLRLAKRFEYKQMEWSEKHGMQLTVSMGYAARETYPKVDLRQLISIADKEMYSAKGEYYKKTGKDRRIQI